MPNRAALLLVVMAIMAGACSSAASPGPSVLVSSTAEPPPATTTTTVTSTTREPDPFVSAYPDVRIERTTLNSAVEPTPTRSVDDVVSEIADPQVPEVVLTEELIFTPSLIEVHNGSRVTFRNDSGRLILITFREDLLPALELEPGAESDVDVAVTGPVPIRYSIEVGNARPNGVIMVTVDEPPPTTIGDDSSAPDEDFTATDRSGALLIEIPNVGSWREVRGYRAITLTPSESAFTQGSLASAFLNGFAPFEPGLRLDAATQDRAVNARELLAHVSLPPTCHEVGIGVVTHPEYPSESRRLMCGSLWVELGFLDTQGDVVYFIVAQDIDDPVGLDQSVGTLSLHEPGSFVERTEPQPFLWHLEGQVVEPDDPTRLEITNGRFGPLSTSYRFNVLSSDTVIVSNFDDSERHLYMNGEPFAKLAPRTGLSFSVDDLELWPAVISVGSEPWARLDVFLDLAERLPRPPANMFARFDPVEFGEPVGEEFIDGGFVFTQAEPIGWELLSRLGRGRRWERQSAGNDVAALTRQVYLSIEDAVDAETIRLRSSPVRSEPGLWYTWEVEGQPSFTLVLLSLDEITPASRSGFVAAFGLESAPQEHQFLLEAALFPMLDSVSVRYAMP